MRLLAARPATKDGPSIPIRPLEDDFVCFFCEYALYYGSEQLRRKAIRAIRAEIKRKEAIKIKAKNVAEGKGLANDLDPADDCDSRCG